MKAAPFLFFLLSLGCTSAPPPVAAPVAPPPPGQRVFIAAYERGPAFVDSANIFEQPAIRAHIAHHENLGERLIAAGPLRIRPEDRTVGYVVLFARNAEEAEQWFRTDPAVLAGVFAGQIREWRVSSIRRYQRPQ